MSRMSNFANHLYGAETNAYNELLPDLVDVFEDIYELRDAFRDGRWEIFPRPVPDVCKALDIIEGPDDLVYIGVAAIMPFERPKWTKKGIEQAVDKLGKYLFGENTKLVCDEYFKAWAE